MDAQGNPSQPRDWSQLKRLGGWLCLDFVNTVNRDTDDESEEWLRSYADLVQWGYSTHLLSEAQAIALRQGAAERPELAEQIFRQAIQLREAMNRLFAAIANHQDIASTDLAILNQSLKQALPQQQIIATPEGFRWNWADAGQQLDCMLWPVARSAAELLTAQELSRVRECSSEDCSWLFVDTSRNRSRRWCDMETCGNRAKAHRHYERRKRS